MINETIGRSEIQAGRDCRRTAVGETGHVIFGPYEPTAPGVYQVEFALMRAGDAPDGNPLVAVLDVAAGRGNQILGEHRLHASDLSSGEMGRFRLLVVNRGFDDLEYRVFTTGAAELLADVSPSPSRVSGVLDEPLRGFPQELMAADRLQRETRAVLGFLKPHELLGHDLVRLGNAGDGGYVCVDDFEGVDTAFSFGINYDISWDRAVADRGLKIFQFDHTVEDPAPDDPRMVFEKKRIDPVADSASETLSNLIRRHDRGSPRPNLILKTDIEGAEWAALEATEEQELSRLAWIVCELHYLQGLGDFGYRQSIRSGLEKLSRHFALVHVHANVCGGVSNIANVIFPNVIEATFVNRALYHVGRSDQLFPSELDMSCDVKQPDLYLGSFLF